MNDFRELKKIRLMDVEIDTKCQELEKLKEMMTKVRISNFDEPVQSTKHPDGIIDIIQRVNELQDEINSKVDAFIEFRKEWLEKIKSLDNVNLYRVAYKRYFEYKTFEKISVEMDLSLRWILKLNNILMNNSNAN